MCSRAIARAAPPTKYKFLPAAANIETDPASARSVASETALALSPSSARRSGPSGSVTPRPISPISPASEGPPALTRINSTLPPPRSTTNPSASGIPASTPVADSRASSGPSMISTGTRHCDSTSAANDRPSPASRTAAVANTARCSAPTARASATNRRKLTSASVLPSGFSLPVEAIPRPRPRSTLWCSSGNKAPPRRSKTTRRSEFEPKSMTAMRPVVGITFGSVIKSANDQSWVTPLQSRTAPRQARVRHEIRMGRERLVIDWYAVIAAIRRQAPALQSVAKIRDHDLVQHLPVHGLVLDRHERLDPSVEIPRHPVGGTDENLGAIRGKLVAVGETDDAPML